MFHTQFRRPWSRRRSLSFTGALVATPFLSLASPGQAEECRLALILALDVSGSVSAAEYRLQREGLATALLAPEVTGAFLSGGPVAVYVFEWAGSAMQAALLAGWVIVQDEADLAVIAGAISQPDRRGLRETAGSAGETALGSALVHAAAAFSAGPDCAARTVDVSGDGINSEGVSPEAVIDALYAGITVNALIIDRPIADPMLELRDGGALPIADWFQRAVVHGPGAFCIVTASYTDYTAAMAKKLVREVQPTLVSGLPGLPGGA